MSPDRFGDTVRITDNVLVKHKRRAAIYVYINYRALNSIDRSDHLNLEYDRGQLLILCRYNNIGRTQKSKYSRARRHFNFCESQHIVFFRKIKIRMLAAVTVIPFRNWINLREYRMRTQPNKPVIALQIQNLAAASTISSERRTIEMSPMIYPPPGMCW